MKCIYGRQECQFEVKGECPRMKTCPYAGKLTQLMQNKNTKKRKGRSRTVLVARK